MKNLFHNLTIAFYLFVLFSFSFATNANAQQNGFTWIVDDCCVTIIIKPDIIENHPLWTLNVGGTIYDGDTDPDGKVEHCFQNNGNFLALLSALPTSYGDIIPITLCNPAQQNGFESITVNECCVTVVVSNNEPKRNWTLDFGDGFTVDYITNGQLDVVSHCYNSSSGYPLTLTYPNGGGAATIVEIDTRVCQNECFVSGLCWENVVCNLQCATAVELLLPNGNTVIIPFTTISGAPNICSDPYFLDPIPNPTDLTGGFCEIATQIIKAITDLGYQVQFDMTDPLEDPEYDCQKGNDPVPGFFFSSDVRVLNVYGNDDCINTYMPGDIDRVNFGQRPCDTE